MPVGNVYTVDEIESNSLESLGIHLTSRRVYRWIETGKLRALRVGGRLYVRRADLERGLPHWGRDDADE